MPSSPEEKEARAQLTRDLVLLVASFVIALVSLALFVVPTFLGFFHSGTRISDSFFATGLGSSIIGLLSFELLPRDAKLWARSSITEGLVAMALVVGGMVLLAVSFGLTFSI